MAVAAAEDDTEVNVTIRVLEPTTCGNVTLSTSDRVQISFRLHAQDVVRVLCKGDITGSVVNSTKPVAVISGNVCVKVSFLKFVSLNQLFCVNWLLQGQLSVLTFIRYPSHPHVIAAARKLIPLILPKVQVADYSR